MIDPKIVKESLDMRKMVQEMDFRDIIIIMKTLLDNLLHNKKQKLILIGVENLQPKKLIMKIFQ